MVWDGMGWVERLQQAEEPFAESTDSEVGRGKLLRWEKGDPLKMVSGWYVAVKLPSWWFETCLYIFYVHPYLGK